MDAIRKTKEVHSLTDLCIELRKLESRKKEVSEVAVGGSMSRNQKLKEANQCSFTISWFENNK